MIPIAAKTQKVARAGSCEVVPSAKAKRSVTEVMVMATPACPMARAIRSAGGFFGSVASSSLTSTNMSSTPMPRRMKGSTVMTGFTSKPSRVEKP